MTVASKAAQEALSTDRLLQLAGLLLCTVAALLPLYYSPLWSGACDDTASLPSTSTESTVDAEPYPFDIVFSANQRGLMLYRGYLYVLKIGDELPDGRHIKEFVEQNGRWLAHAS